MNTRKELLIGCGSRRIKDRRLPTWKEIERGQSMTGARLGTEFENLVTLDINPAHAPDIVFNLCLLGIDSMPCIHDQRCPDNTYDEIHAYEVLEHIGRQGDAQTFFYQFTEFHRILKPGGLFYATCPAWFSQWAWGDPSHTRVITAGTLAFLSQKEYAKQVGKTPMSDFRDIYKADFDVVVADESTETLCFVLRAVK